MNTPLQVNPSLRLAQYLRDFVGLRTTVVRDVTTYDSVLWFGDLPQQKDCYSPAWEDGSEQGAPWLEVKKQVFDPMPEPPVLIAPWLDLNALKRASIEMPTLNAKIFKPDETAKLSDGETPPLREHLLSDNPDVTTAYNRYRHDWVSWSVEYRRRESIQDIYATLFSLHTQLRKQGEILEVVLGLGLLDWQPSATNRATAIRRHVVVANIDLEFDPAKGVMRVVASGDGARLRLEDDMLEAELRPDRSLYDTTQTLLDNIGDEIWDKPLIFSALQSWGGALHPDMQWSPNLRAFKNEGSRQVMSFAPALILRKRTHTGMVRIYQELIDNLTDDTIEIPDGWRSLVNDIDDFCDDEPIDYGDADHTNTTSSGEIYFPLPANREQRGIVRAIERQRGVLVQGPPGTGKSHTIANLICHLLATGKRVLITAETGRALQVLKAKLPEEIQPLCVSLLGQGGDSFTELNSAVQGITTKQASYVAGSNDKRVQEIEDELNVARKNLATVQSEIRSLRSDETIQHQIGHASYTGTASAIAGRVTQERDLYGWLKLPNNAADEPPVTVDEIQLWLSIRRRYSENDIAHAKLKIPPSNSLPDPQTFAGAVQTEAHCASEVEQTNAQRKHVAYLPLMMLTKESRQQFGNSLRTIQEQRVILTRHTSEWSKTALRDLVAGRKARWDTILQRSGQLIPKVEDLLLKVADRVVSYPDEPTPQKMRADAQIALAYLKSGGTWKRMGIITPAELKGRTYLRDHVLVNGISAGEVELLQVVSEDLELSHYLNELRTVWNESVAAETTDRRMLFAEIREKHAELERCFKFVDICNLLGKKMAALAPPIPEPDWLIGNIQEWIDLLSVIEIEVRYKSASLTVANCTKSLKDLHGLHDAHPVVSMLWDAVVARDINEYSKCHAQIMGVELIRASQLTRKDIKDRLITAVPQLVNQIISSISDPVWDSRFDQWSNAWRWAVADCWLEKRSNVEYQQKLWRQQYDQEKLIGKLLAEAAALRAWSHFFKRLSTKETASLKSWREAVKSMGKGTGKSARLARLRREARIYMDACRDAIPIWIMPRYLVADMIVATPGRYDLVIVDEASQLGIDSLFLFYIAKKIIVVGDDQQISPYGVGIADEAIAGLQQLYLENIPHQHALSAQSSLYANAKIRFNQNIVLREHFRCMPEIIQFSNDLCYASNGTPLDPLRAYPANRLQPLVLRHVDSGYRTGSSQNAQNPPEADAIVAQIAACIDDPRYRGKTMGVISLQGEAQAKLIERRLLEKIQPEIIEERQLICGDAYTFQGDERHIIFLSMVAARGESRIGALTKESARQRFNVAVSRAQDQLWLFYTATLDDLSPVCMRYGLLSYMMDPSRKTTTETEQAFESEFERSVYQLITERGFHVRTQVCVGDPTNHRYRIDLVVEGMQGKLAVECDGDQWHGPERYEYDMSRQRDLERAGWQFVRIRGGDFYRDCVVAMEPVWAELERLGIRPGGVDVIAGEPPRPKDMTQIDSDEKNRIAQNDDQPILTSEGNGVSSSPQDQGQKTLAQDEIHNLPGNYEQTTVKSGPAQLEIIIDSISSSNSSITRTPYEVFSGKFETYPNSDNPVKIAIELCKIIDVEGPMLAKRAYDIYLRGCDIHRLGGELKKLLNKSLQRAIFDKRIVKEDESSSGGLLYTIVRTTGTPSVRIRERGPRDFEEIPPSEIQVVAQQLLNEFGYESGSDDHLRAILEFYDLKRLTTQVGTTLLDIINK